MKTITLLLFVVVSFSIWGQTQLLSELDASKNFKSLSKVKTLDVFYQKLISLDDSILFNIIKENLGERGKLEIKSISTDTLKLKSTFCYCERSKKDTVFVNKEVEVFKITHNDKKLYFYPEKGIFFKDCSTPQNFDNVIKQKLEQAYTALKLQYKKKKRAVHPKVFNDNMLAIKQAVMLNSSGDATNNSAVLLNVSNAESKIGASVNMTLHEKIFINANFSTDASGGFFYSDKAWSTTTGGGVTFNWSVCKPKQFYLKSDAALLRKQRDLYKEKLIERYNFLSKERDKLLDTLKTQNDTALNPLTLESRKKYLKNLDDLESLENEIKEYQDIIKNPSSYMNNEIAEFDAKNDILYGGKIHWLKVNVKWANQTLNLDIKDDEFIGKKIELATKFGAELSYNFNGMYQNNKYCYAQGYFGANAGNMLDVGLGSKRPKLDTQSDNSLVRDSRDNVLGYYHDLDRAIWRTSIGAQGAYLWKHVGVSLQFDYTHTPKAESYFKNRLSLLAGLILKAHNKEDNNVVTVRFLVGYENMPVKSIAKDFLTFKMGIGVPFYLYSKKKDK